MNPLNYAVSIALLATLVLPSLASALELNGIASFQQLRKEYYIGALYLDQLQKSPGEIIASTGHKRMVIKVTTKKWSPRRWALTWQDNIAINNDLDANPDLLDDIMALTSFPHGPLTKGDELVIEYKPTSGTKISLNRQLVVQEDNSALFAYLLKTWVGKLPPSKEFKQRILKRQGDETEKTLLTTFNGLALPVNRERVVEQWVQSDLDKELASIQAEQDAQNKEKESDEKKRLAAQKSAAILAKKEAKKTAQKREKARKAAKLAQERKRKNQLKRQRALKLAAKAKANKSSSIKRKSKATLAAENKYFFKHFQWELKRDIRNRIVYPAWAKQFSQEGTVNVSFSVNKQGDIVRLSNKDKTVSKMLVSGN